MTQIEIKLDMHYLNRVEWVWFESQPTSKNTTIMQTLIWQHIQRFTADFDFQHDNMFALHWALFIFH